jgi:hypothetical protein
LNLNSRLFINRIIVTLDSIAQFHQLKILLLPSREIIISVQVLPTDLNK